MNGSFKKKKEEEEEEKKSIIVMEKVDLQIELMHGAIYLRKMSIQNHEKITIF